MREGQSFEEFAMQCARNFGACVTMRDDPMDAKIPTAFKPSNYFDKRLDNAKRTVRRLEAMSKVEREKFGEKEKAKSIAAYRKMLREDREENARLVEMQSQVEKWNPPTADHIGLRVFMLEQIKVSMNDTAYFEGELSKEEQRPAIDFWVQALSWTKRDVEFTKEERRKEIERCNGRTNWVQTLRNSLKP